MFTMMIRCNAFALLALTACTTETVEGAPSAPAAPKVNEKVTVAFQLSKGTTQFEGSFGQKIELVVTDARGPTKKDVITFDGKCALAKDPSAIVTVRCVEGAHVGAANIFAKQEGDTIVAYVQFIDEGQPGDNTKRAEIALTPGAVVETL